MWNGGGLYLGLRSMTFEFDEEEEYSGSKPIWTLHCLSFFSVWLWLWLLVWVWLCHWAISCRHLPATDEKRSLRRKWQFCPTQMSKITKLILKKKRWNELSFKLLLDFGQMRADPTRVVANDTSHIVRPTAQIYQSWAAAPDVAHVIKILRQTRILRLFWFPVDDQAAS